MLDNVFLGGRVLDREPRRGRPRSIAELNDRIAADDRVEVAMLGVADGITLALASDERDRTTGVARAGPLRPAAHLEAARRGLGRPRLGARRDAGRDHSRRRPTARSSTRSSTRTASGCSARWRRSRRPTSEAGVRAWTVWVPEADDRGRRGAGGRRPHARRRAARHGHGALRAARARDRSGARDPRATTTTPRWRASTRSPTAIRRATSGPSRTRRCPDLRIYFAELDGEAGRARSRSGPTAPTRW